jgi:ubiquinone/menaquinone biosynthesis C-methylase UbiE
VQTFGYEARSLQHYRKRARWYDWANRLAALLRGTSGRRERLKAIARLRLEPGDRVLEVSSGTGTNLLLLEESWAGGGRVGLDLTREMLVRSRERWSHAGTPLHLVEGEDRVCRSVMAHSTPCYIMAVSPSSAIARVPSMR